MGFGVQSNMEPFQTIETLRSAKNQISRIINRITRRREDMREDTLRLVLGLVISRVMR